MPRSAAASAHTRPRYNDQSDLPTASLAGSIRWLPSNNEVGDVGLERGCYKHPVVVLSSKAQDGSVDILIVTSLGGKDLLDKFPRATQLRRAHLPIKPSNAHPDHGVLLVFTNQRQRLQKRSYVQTHNVLKVPLKALRPFKSQGGRDYCLSKESFSTLLGYCAFVPPTSLSLPEERVAVNLLPQSPVILDQPRSHRQVSEARRAQLFVQATIGSIPSRTESHSHVSPPTNYLPSNRGYGAIPSRRYEPPGAYPPPTPRNYYQRAADPFTHPTTREPNQLRRRLWTLLKLLFKIAIIGGLGYGLYYVYCAMKVVKISKVRWPSLKTTMSGLWANVPLWFGGFLNKL
ncbi:hypothetical protein HD806DRAFT_486693 [Xylariaceae sp. AK1471]|nr:hypothetical protein HD806DRAFT_486693 [Xylariaceae sp. AK1471]